MRLNLKGLFIAIGITIVMLQGGYYKISLADENKMKKNQSKEQLIFGANIRFRYEYQDNFNCKYYGDQPKKGESHDGFLLGRFRFGFDYYPNQNLHLSLWIQDSEVWDSALGDSDFYKSEFDREFNCYTDHWEPYNTFLEIREVLPFSMKVGRQLFRYGNNRVFGPAQWGNTGSWVWDAAKIGYQFKDGFVDAYYGGTMIHDPDVLSLRHSHGYESFGSYSQFKLSKRLLNFTLEPFAMTKVNKDDRYKGEDGQPGNLDSYYVGARIFKNDLKGFDGDFTFIKREGDYASDDIDAYGYHMLLAYNIKQIGFKPRLSVEYSYASGDKDPADGKHGTFDAAFGARDRMYGRINLFHWKNLKDAQINLEVRPEKWLYFKVEYHQFRLAEEKDAWSLNKTVYRDTSGNSGDEVGKEIDLVGKFKLPKGNEIRLGFSYFWPGEFAENVASDQNAHWVFLQWTYNFSYPLF